jgi:hypothetical protein
LMRDRALSLLILTFPPLVLGIVVGVGLIAAQTLVVYPERRVAPEVSLGVVYLLSTVWGLTLGAATAVLSIAAFDFFHVQPALQFVPAVSSGAGGIRDLPARRATTRLGRGAGSVAGQSGSTTGAARPTRHGDGLLAAGRPTTAIELGQVLVPAGLPEGTEGRVRGRVVASMHALLRAARNREGMVSAVER